MVIEDFNFTKRNNPIETSRAASLLDRFFSFVIDYFVISPFVIFFLYLSYTEGFRFWKAQPQSLESTYFVLILAISYVFYFSLIQSFFIYWKGATPGQFYLKVRIQLNDGDSLAFLRVLTRQVLFWASFLLLGLPLLALLTNSRRRTFYDRVADVEVQSNLEQPAEVFEEPRYWQAFVGTLTLFCGFLCAAWLWQSYDKVAKRSFSFQAALRSGLPSEAFCSELGELRYLERLETAIALNWVGELSDECLRKEADFVLWSVPSPELESLAYYAKSLLTNEPSIEKKYLKQACAGAEQNSERSYGCQVAQAFLDADLQSFLESPQKNNILDQVLRYEHLVLRGEYRRSAQEFKRLSEVSPAIRELKIFKKYHLKEFLVQYGHFDNGRKPASEPFGSAGQTGINKEFIDAVINRLEEF